MDIEIPSKRYNNLTMEERDALYSLRDDSTNIIKGPDKGSVVVDWDREDYLKEAYKQLENREVYEEVSNDPNVLDNTIIKALEKIRFQIFRYPKFLYPKCISVYTMYLVDQ